MVVAPHDDDARLLKGCLDGRPGAWEAFLARFTPYLGAVCRAALRRSGLPAGRPEVEDILQEVLVGLLAARMKALRAYRGQAPLAAYLATLAVNRIAKEIRPWAPLPPGTAASSEDPSGILDAREAEALLRAGMDALPPILRLALTLRADGTTLREIGQVLGVSKDKAAGFLDQGRTILRKRLEEGH